MLPSQNQVPQHTYSTVHRSYTINAALSNQQVLVPLPSDRNHLTAVGLVLSTYARWQPVRVWSLVLQGYTIAYNTYATEQPEHLNFLCFYFVI